MGCRWRHKWGQRLNHEPRILWGATHCPPLGWLTHLVPGVSLALSSCGDVACVSFRVEKVVRLG